MDNPNLDNIVLALLFAADEPLSARKMAAVIEDVTVADVRQAIDTWNARADAEVWSIGIEQVAGGYRLSTRAEYAPYVSRLYSGRRRFRLSRAGLETLAIIAYKQPITRAEIETIRGVGSGSVVANLMERSLVEITGKAKVLGAPFLYGTTQEFLEYLGLNSIRDLPSVEDLEALLVREASEAALEADEAPANLPIAMGEDPVAGPELGVENGALRAAREPEDGGEPNRESADAPKASSARLGPRVDEPVNRPLYDRLDRSGKREVAETGHDDEAPDADDEDSAEGSGEIPGEPR